MDIDQVKAANPIETVVEKEFPLRQSSGRWLRAIAHDSLIVDARNQAYYWNSQGERGDVITWVMNRQRLDFKAAVEWLCRQANLPDPDWGGEQAQHVAARRLCSDALTIAAQFFARTLSNAKAARDYCASRGWSDETIKRAGLGFVSGDLRAEFAQHHVDVMSPGAQAALKISRGMIVYPHVQGGRVVYLSARSIEGKQHYNPPVDLIGERLPYHNHEYHARASGVVVVEGQADAITLGQWNIPAIALAGVNVSDDLLRQLARHDTVYVGLDTDEAGQKAAQQLADGLGPLVRMVTWPEKDANEWLKQGGTSETCRDLLLATPTWVELRAQWAARQEGAAKEAALRECFGLVARMDDFAVANYRKRLTEVLGVGVREFNAMLKVTRDTTPRAETNGDPLLTIPEVGRFIDGNLIELIYQPPNSDDNGNRSGQTLFAIRRADGSIGTVPHLDVNNVRYVPVPPMSKIIRICPKTTPHFYN